MKWKYKRVDNRKVFNSGSYDIRELDGTVTDKLYSLTENGHWIANFPTLLEAKDFAQYDKKINNQ